MKWPFHIKISIWLAPWQGVHPASLCSTTALVYDPFLTTRSGGIIYLVFSHLEELPISNYIIKDLTRLCDQSYFIPSPQKLSSKALLNCFLLLVVSFTLIYFPTLFSPECLIERVNQLELNLTLQITHINSSYYNITITVFLYLLDTAFQFCCLENIDRDSLIL